MDLADYRQKMRPAKLGLSRSVNIGYSDIQWEFFGPYNLQPRYVTGQGPASSFMSGRVNGVAFDNRNQGIFYVAAASGGVWKADATTGTTVWTPLGDKFPFMETSSVVTDPTNGRILYVGLGDFFGPGSGQGEGLDTPRFSGNTTATALGIMKSVNGGTTFVNVGKNEMAGQAVSAIVVYPKDTRILVASTGRGVNPGSLWRSTDGGATWAKPTLKSGGTVPAGDWNTVRVFNPYNRTDATAPPYPAKLQNPGVLDPTSPLMYATRINDGIYRSDDRGATWRRITNAPINFNLPASAGRKTLLVTPSATDPYVIYFMDTSSAYDDGRIFRGQPQNRADINGTGALAYLWTDVTGNYNTANGAFNNWSRSEYASSLMAAPTIYSVPQPAKTWYTGSTIYLDTLYGGNRTLSASKGADPYFTLSLPLSGSLWSDLLLSYSGPPADRTQAWQRDIQYDPFDPRAILVANDGGVYKLNFNLSTWTTTTNLNTSGDVGGSTSADVRKQAFAVTQINGADFSPTNPDYAVAGAQHMGVLRFPTGSTGWVNVGATASDFSSGFGANPPTGVSQYGGNTAIMGTREFAWVISGGGGNRLVMTTGSWAAGSVFNITPDQSFTGTSTSGTAETHYPFPYSSTPDTGSTDTSVQSAWAGQTKSANPVLTADTGNGLLYTGTNALWWYNPTGRESGWDTTGMPPVTQPGVGGRWKQVGTTTFGGVVTAIAITTGPDNPNPFNTAGQRAYVGTSTGEVWITVNDRARDLQTPAPTTGPAASLATWQQINNASLPAGRPITSISVNPTHPEDILVTLGGVGGGHVYRCQDTKGSQILYTDQSGLVTDPADPNYYTRLPDNLPVNGITRDALDPTHTFYVATDAGVFVTTDSGSTWQDATTPLGLPNVPCVSIKYVTQPTGVGYLNVATYGRGLWRIKTTSAQQVFATPNLTSSFTLNRIGNEIFAVITVTNVQRKDALGNKIATGLAENVKITTSSIAGSTSANTTTTLPVVLGAIAPGSSRQLTLRYPATVGAAGSAATFKVNGTYVTQTQAGPSTLGTSFPDVRTRLP